MYLLTLLEPPSQALMELFWNEVLAPLNSREDIPVILPVPRQSFVLADIPLFIPKMLTKSSAIPNLHFLLIV